MNGDYIRIMNEEVLAGQFQGSVEAFLWLDQTEEFG